MRRRANGEPPLRSVDLGDGLDDLTERFFAGMGQVFLFRFAVDHEEEQRALSGPQSVDGSQGAAFAHSRTAPAGLAEAARAGDERKTIGILRDEEFHEGSLFLSEPAVDVSKVAGGGDDLEVHGSIIRESRRERKGSIPVGVLSGSPMAAEAADCVGVVTDHRCFDYEEIGRRARLVVDTPNAMKAGEVVRLWGRWRACGPGLKAGGVRVRGLGRSGGFGRDRGDAARGASRRGGRRSGSGREIEVERPERPCRRAGRFRGR